MQKKQKKNKEVTYIYTQTAHPQDSFNATIQIQQIRAHICRMRNRDPDVFS